MRRAQHVKVESAHSWYGRLGGCPSNCEDSALSSNMVGLWKGCFMEISVSEEVQAQLDQVKEWMESKIGRDVTYNDVLLQVLKNFQSVLYPEDLGSA
jgi:hypothetical protein